MKYILFFILPLLLIGKAYGTNQRHDKIIIKNDTLKIFNFENHIRFNKNITKKINEINKGYYSTGCWRGYIATWEISDNKLYLVNIINYKDSTDLKKLVELTYGKKFVNGKLEVNNVNTEFYCGVKPVYCGSILPMSEKEYKITIKNGEVVEKQLIEYNNCDYKPYDELLLTHIYNQIDWSVLEGKNLLARLVVVVDESGKVINCKRGEEYFKNEKIYNQLNSIFLDLPCLQVYISEGKFQPEMFLTLYFNNETKEKYVR